MRQRKPPRKSEGAPKFLSKKRAVNATENRLTRSQAAQGTTQQGPAAYRRDGSQEKENLALIVSGTQALALVSLQGYLSLCISTLKEITQKRSGLFMILCLTFVAAVAGAFCGTVLPMWMLWAKGVAQVLLEQPVADLKSVRNSLALLEEQAQEVQQLRKEVVRLAAEMSHVKKDLQDISMAISAMPLEESVQMSAWALRSTGVTIDLQRSPRSYAWPCSAFWFLCDLNRLDTFVQRDISVGYCWPFQASGMGIRLPARVRPTAITVQHPLKKSSALGDISSAPRDFTVSGVDEEGGEETLLGTFSYDREKEPAQTFPLPDELPRAFQFLRLVIRSNWGKSGYSCIYRVRVDGKIVG